MNMKPNLKPIVVAVGFALLCAAGAHAQEAVIVQQQPDTVVVQDPDPPTPGIQQMTTTTTTEHTATVDKSPAPKTVHHPVRRRPVRPAPVAYHGPARVPAKTVDTTDTQTTTQTTVTIPPHDPSTVVSEHADGSVTVTSDRPPVEVPVDQDDQH